MSELTCDKYEEVLLTIRANREKEEADIKGLDDPDLFLEEGYRILEIDNDGDGSTDEVKKVLDTLHPRWSTENPPIKDLDD